MTQSSAARAGQLCKYAHLGFTSKLLGALAVSEPLTLRKIPGFRGPESPEGGARQVRGAAWGLLCRFTPPQRQDGCRDCTRLLSKREVLSPPLNGTGWDFHLASAAVYLKAGLNSGKVHPQLFPEMATRRCPRLCSAEGGSCPAWTRVSLLTEEVSCLTEEASGTSPRGRPDPPPSLRLCRFWSLSPRWACKAGRLLEFATRFPLSVTDCLIGSLTTRFGTSSGRLYFNRAEINHAGF